ncbi:MAG: Gfo/Idh/MocA family oxidoreductase [Actinobacteria bacterium]|nr:Gfo/Idh/MocA family oxidoreductase [Cyanobacteriota bacterium]MCL5771623.1 Gfo/Idh/MocA family oxidoreductase [Actinomycetota bacterium]
MINVAIIGAGYIGQVHANTYKQINNARIFAIVDSIEEKGKKLADQFDANYFSNIDELLNDKNIADIDCIDICSPTFLHSEMAIKTANAGKDFLIEKPLSLSLEEADKIIEAVKRNKVQAMVGHVLRFWPEYIKAKEIVDSGDIGKPLFAFSERLTVTPDWHVNKWGFDEKHSGGAALDLHIHDLDYLIWLLGKPVIVKSQGVYNPKLGGLVHITTNIEFKNGFSGFAEGGWSFTGNFPFTMVLRIICENGTIEWVFRAGKNIEERNQKNDLIVYRSDGSVYVPNVEQKDPFLTECEYFINCLDFNRPIEKATIADGRESLKLTLAAIESAKNKNTVYLK